MGVLIMFAAGLLASAALLALATAWVIFSAKVYRESKATLFIQSGAGLALAVVILLVGAAVQTSGH